MRQPLIGFEGFYEVSDDGIVYRIARGKGGEVGPLKPYCLKNGYLTVYPSKNDRRKQMSVHHAVAEAFIGPREGREVNHKNGIKTDNRASNLEYVTRQENATHAMLNGLMKRGEDRWNAKLDARSVVQIRALRKQGMKCAQLADWFGVSDKTISSVVRRETWKWIPA